MTRLAESLGASLILRDPWMRKSLVETEKRLREIDARSLDPQSTGLANGLPESREAAERMGAFAGDPDVWMQFRREFESASADKAQQRIHDKESLFRELTSGDSDVLLVVAEANSSAIYFNGEKVALRELEMLPSRPASLRPRQVVLFSCFAGRYPGVSTTLWERLRIVRSNTPLAQILLRKGFADRVIAPVGAIGAEETIQVLKQILQGSDARIEIPRKNWMKWARIIRRLVTDEWSV